LLERGGLVEGRPAALGDCELLAVWREGQAAGLALRALQPARFLARGRVEQADAVGSGPQQDLAARGEGGQTLARVWGPGGLGGGRGAGPRAGGVAIRRRTLAAGVAISLPSAARAAALMPPGCRKRVLPKRTRAPSGRGSPRRSAGGFTSASRGAGGSG